MSRSIDASDLGAEAWEAARDAIEHYAEPNLSRFAREATRAIEVGGKAVLANINPVLIADPKSVESQLHLAGHPVARTKGERRIRTISCRETLDRLTHLMPTLRPQEIWPLIEVRDGSTHFLVSDREAVESLVVPFLAALSLIQLALNANDDDVFGSYAELVVGIRQEHTKKVDRLVAAKIARAQHMFTERYGHLDSKALETVIRAIESGILLDGYDEQITDCPACGHEGVIGGHHEFQEWEVDDYDDEGVPSGVTPVVVLFTNEFKCGTCGLHLEDSDELEAAGFDRVLNVEDARAEDFWEPDEDRLEDR